LGVEEAIVAKTCPECRLLNPDIATRCDCGFDFESGVMKESLLPAEGGLNQKSFFSPLTTVDIGLAVLFPLIGFIIGLYRLIARKPGSSKMLGLSATAMALFLFVKLIT
jgi:hypothetical protein